MGFGDASKEFKELNNMMFEIVTATQGLKNGIRIPSPPRSARVFRANEDYMHNPSRP